MTWLLFLACSGPSETADSTDTEDTDTEDTGLPEPLPNYVTSPAEATDIDPAEDVLHVALSAGPLAHQVGDLQIDGYGYNGQTPGPTLRAKVGDRIVVDFTNELDAATTIHWHGLSVPYDMDGVVWTEGGVEPGTAHRYEFTATRAGTFWYHPHVDSAHQVDHGLYGVIVIEDPDEPTLDDLVLVFDDWSAGASEEGHGRAEGTWTVNGVVEPTVLVDGGRPLRVRMLNASNHGYLDLAWPDIRWIAGDQGLLPSLQSPERLQLGPGDRAEVEWLPGRDDWELLDHPYADAGPAFGDATRRLAVEVDGPADAPAASGWAFSGAAPTPDSPPAITYVFTGEETDWYINGERFPDVTVESLPIDEPSVIEVRNLSGSEHPFHIHGMEFEVLSVNGVAPSFQQVEDTWNLGVYERIRILVRPQHSGFWMAHCHILEHAEDGMMTVLEVPAAE